MPVAKCVKKMAIKSVIENNYCLSARNKECEKRRINKVNTCSEHKQASVTKIRHKMLTLHI